MNTQINLSIICMEVLSATASDKKYQNEQLTNQP